MIALGGPTLKQGNQLQVRHRRRGLNDSTGRAYTETEELSEAGVLERSLNDSTGRAYTETGTGRAYTETPRLSN